WRPDFIFASAPPFTALLVAKRLSDEFGIPWVAELRDLWTQNPYYAYPRWRRWIDEIIERRVLLSAHSLVTVTPLWARDLKSRYPEKTVTTIFNGYAEEDYWDLSTYVSKEPKTLSIVYTGNIYRGYRDPSALFAAIGLLGKQRDKVLVH